MFAPVRSADRLRAVIVHEWTHGQMTFARLAQKRRDLMDRLNTVHGAWLRKYERAAKVANHPKDIEAALRKSGDWISHYAKRGGVDEFIAESVVSQRIGTVKSTSAAKVYAILEEFLK